MYLLKRFLSLVLLLATSSALAQEIRLWRDEANINKVKAKDATAVFWLTQSQCETDTGQTCFDVTGLDIRRWQVNPAGTALIPDPAGDAQADTEDTARQDEKNTRNTKMAEREVELLDCVQDTKNPTLNPTQTKACIGAIVREILGSKVAVEDL